MIIFEQLRIIDGLKRQVYSFRPFPPAVVKELQKLYDVRFTYHSNAIEGNTLTQSETEMVLEKGITVGGKTLREHLEVIGHKEAIDHILEISQGEAQISERDIKARRKEYIDNLVYAQENGDNTEKLTHLVAEAAKTSLREQMELLSTAGQRKQHQCYLE